jgi:hypothetical protein
MINKNISSLHFLAYLQFTFSNTLPKIVKKLSNPSLNDKKTIDNFKIYTRIWSKGQQVTRGHTQYGGYSVFHRLWLVSAFLHLDSEMASKLRTAHTAIRYRQV